MGRLNSILTDRFKLKMEGLMLKFFWLWRKEGGGNVKGRVTPIFLSLDSQNMKCLIVFERFSSKFRFTFFFNNESPVFAVFLLFFLFFWGHVFLFLIKIKQFFFLKIS